MPSTPPKALRPSSPFQAQGEISPGKDIDLRCTTAGSTSPCLGHNSFAVDCPLAVLGSAFYPVPVRRPAASLPASFTPASRSDALRFASLAVTSSREDFHLLVNAHAGHTANGSRERAPDDRLREAIHIAAETKDGLLRRFAPRNDEAGKPLMAGVVADLAGDDIAE